MRKNSALAPVLQGEIGMLVNSPNAPAHKGYARPVPSVVGGLRKRGFDITVALLALLILLPLMLIVALLVWRQDGRRVVFGHMRIGAGGRAFRCLKFRSMVPDAGAVLARVLAENPVMAAEWAETQKLRDDPRITPIGRVLRVSSLDELPQLLNVLTGHMSIVGPRPIVAGEAERYGAGIESYYACRPGITGMWQVSGRSDCGYRERVALDVAYARQWSFTRDLLIILRTVGVVLGRRGSC